MRDLALAIIVFSLGLAALIHVYWAAGGRWAADAAVPRHAAAKGGAALFQPSPLITLAVAVVLVGVAALASLVHSNAAIGMPWFWARSLLAVCGGGFVLRAIGDFRYVGFFKRVTDSRFAYWDTRVFSPLILLIGLACLLIAAQI